MAMVVSNPLIMVGMDGCLLKMMVNGPGQNLVMSFLAWLGISVTNCDK